VAVVVHRHNIWMHVDAAWAGSAAMLPEQRQWFKGLEKVDSYSFNPHSKSGDLRPVLRASAQPLMHSLD
jgi:glutamate/tyrosine decarboxylase-like PLP-dependent enzyme